MRIFTRITGMTTHSGVHSLLRWIRKQSLSMPGGLSYVLAAWTMTTSSSLTTLTSTVLARTRTGCSAATRKLAVECSSFVSTIRTRIERCSRALLLGGEKMVWKLSTQTQVLSPISTQFPTQMMMSGTWVVTRVAARVPHVSCQTLLKPRSLSVKSRL